MPYYDKQALDYAFLDRGEWELLLAIADGQQVINEENARLTLPLLFVRRVVQEVEHMRTVWANPATVSDLIKEGIAVSRSMSSYVEAAK